MDVTEFRETLNALEATNSRTEKKEVIRDVQDDPAAISFLSGSEFDSAGVGQKTVLSVAQDVFGEDAVDMRPSVSESLTDQDEDKGGLSLSFLRDDMNTLEEKGGNEMKAHLEEMFELYSCPSVVSQACLDDAPISVGDSTIANAMKVRDSLPFYDSVVEIAEESGTPDTEPTVGSAFAPMLAKSDSHLPEEPSAAGMWAQPKVDGYRLILHIEAGEARAFTRRMNEVTESLPELSEIRWPAGEFVIDCEVIADDGTYKSTSERIGRDADSVEREHEMQFGCFDTVVYAGEQLMDSPYRNRHAKLESFVVSSNDDHVHRLDVHKNVSESEARAIGADYEGLIWKDPESTYEFGKRSSSWVKQKNTAEAVDLCVAGFVEGEGRLSESLGKIALETSDGQSVGYAGSGFSDSEREQVWANQDEYRGSVVEIEAEAFDDGLRFPIFKRWRSEDGEADSLERVETLLSDL